MTPPNWKHALLLAGLMAGCGQTSPDDDNLRPEGEAGAYRYVLGVDDGGHTIYGGTHHIHNPVGKADLIDSANRPQNLHPELVGEYTKHDPNRKEGESDWNIFASSWWNMDGNGIARRWVGNNKDYNNHSVINTDGAPTERYDLLTGGQPVVVNAVSHKNFRDDDGEKHDHPKLTVAGPATAWEMKNHGIYQSGAHPEGWWGHCNGWASYATAEPGNAPQRDIWVKLDGDKVTECTGNTSGCVFFRMGDIEALMTELYFSDQATFAGRRCQTAPDKMERDEYGRPVDPACRDLNPGSWHTAVVGLLNRGATPLMDTDDLDIQFPPFIIDHTYDYEVWNYPVKRFRIDSDVSVTASQANQLVAASGSTYKFNTQATKFRHVKMSYWMISDGVPFSTMKLRADKRGIAPVKVDLHYVLELKTDNTILGGEWIDTPSAPGPDSKKLHPDFFWIGKDNRGYGENADDTGGNDDNPYVSYKVVKSLLTCANDATTCAPAGTGGGDNGGFDWGTGCQDGSGSFSQNIAHQAKVEVGSIPAGLGTVTIELDSAVDVDVQLIDKATGTEIIAWPNGMLNGAGESCTTYQGVEYCYSGYNGVGGRLGKEWIRIKNPTNRELVMKAFGYAEGDAQVNYSWTATDDCVDSGSGSFNQDISHRATVVVGDIPKGKSNIRIDLTSTKDVDIQITDKSDGTEIVAWPNGLINTAGKKTITYKGMVITYSGYNGVGGQLGKEYITIKGEVSTTLTMRAYGYAAGTAQVDYAWGLTDNQL